MTASSGIAGMRFELALGPADGDTTTVVGVGEVAESVAERRRGGVTVCVKSGGGGGQRCGAWIREVIVVCCSRDVESGSVRVSRFGL